MYSTYCYFFTEFTHKESALRQQPMPRPQQAMPGQCPDPRRRGSGLLSAFCPCPPPVPAPKGEGGCALKGLIKKDLLYLGSVSPSFPEWHTLEPADERWQVAQAGKSREKRSYLGKH